MSEHPQPSLLGSLWRFRTTSIAIVVAMLVLGYVVTMATATGATATATIGLRTPGTDNVLAPGLSGDASLGRYTAQRAKFVTSDDVMRSVSLSVGESDLTALRKRLAVSPSSTSNLITVTAEGDDAASAVVLANAVIEAYQRETTAQIASMTQSAIDALQNQISTTVTNAEASGASGVVASSAVNTLSEIQTQIANLEASKAILDDGVEFVVAPTESSAIEPGLPIRELALATLVGLAIATSLSWWRADRDRRVLSSEHAERLLERPALAEVVQLGNVTPATGAELGRYPEQSYDLLWATVWQTVQRGVLVVQPVGRARAADVTINLAAAAAREDLRVLVVDAGVSQGAASARLGRGAQRTGVRDALRPGADWRTHLVEVEVVGRFRFHLLPAGPNADDYVATSRVRACVDEWRAAYDYVFIDAEPLGETQLASKLAASADALVPVVGRSVDEPHVIDFRRQADILGVPIAGFTFAERAGFLLATGNRFSGAGAGDRAGSQPKPARPVQAPDDVSVG